MMQHFDIDVLMDYGVAEFPDTEKVINPAWRKLSRLRYRSARFAGMTIHPENENGPRKYDKWLKKKADLLEEIEIMEFQRNNLKSETEYTSTRCFQTGCQPGHCKLFEHLNSAQGNDPGTALNGIRPRWRHRFKSYRGRGVR